MNRKHNPLVALAALVLLATILVLACTGCEINTAPPADENPARFVTENVKTDGRGACYIITDTETGVQYLYFHSGSSAGGLTVLQSGED